MTEAGRTAILHPLWLIILYACWPPKAGPSYFIFALGMVYSNLFTLFFESSCFLLTWLFLAVPTSPPHSVFNRQAWVFSFGQSQQAGDRDL